MTENIKLTQEEIKTIEDIEVSIFNHLKKLPEKNYFGLNDLSIILYSEKEIRISSIPDALLNTAINRLAEKEFIRCENYFSGPNFYRGDKFSEWENEINL